MDINGEILDLKDRVKNLEGANKIPELPTGIFQPVDPEGKEHEDQRMVVHYFCMRCEKLFSDTEEAHEHFWGENKCKGK